MSGEWQGDLVSEGPPDAVVTYTAVVRLSLERSSISFSQSVSRERLIDALSRAPAWTLDPWSPRQGGTDEELTATALQKIKAVLDFRAGIKEQSADGIRAALQARFPQVAEAKGDSSAGIERFKSYVVEAAVRADGEAEWGFVTPEAGADPAGLRSDDPDGELRIFLQNTARADIVERLSKLG